MGSKRTEIQQSIYTGIMKHQGKSKEQLKGSYIMVAISVVGIIVSILIAHIIK